MIVLKVAFRNLTRSKRRNLLLGGLFAIVVALLVVANAIFASSSGGMRSAFTRSLSGDLVVAAKADDDSFSLFGNETLIVSDYVQTPVLSFYADLDKELAAIPDIESSAAQVTSAGLLQIGEASTKAALFGVELKPYFAVCDGIKYAGSIPENGSHYILLNRAQRDSFEASLNRKLEIGEPITATFASGDSFRIRTLPYSGCIEYTLPSDSLNRIALIDPSTARALNGYDLGFAGENADVSASTAYASLDDIFSGAPDVVDASSGGIDPSDVESLLAKKPDARQVESASSVNGDWNYVIMRLKLGSNSLAVKRQLESIFAARGWDLRVMEWYEAAGVAAQGIFFLQFAFAAGMTIIVLGALIMLMNSLVLSILERKSEIGSMRAIGASKGFVSGLFAAESLLLVGIASIVGILIGSSIALILSSSGIPLSNPSLVSLFGSAILKPVVRLEDILLFFFGALAAGGCAWVYPTILVLKEKPVRAMDGK